MLLHVFLEKMRKDSEKNRQRRLNTQRVRRLRAEETGAVYHDDNLTIWKKSPWKNIKSNYKKYYTNNKNIPSADYCIGQEIIDEYLCPKCPLDNTENCRRK